MGMLSDFAQNKMTDALLRGQALAAPATLFFELLTCTHGTVARSTTYAVNNTAVVSAQDGKLHLYKVTAQTAATAASAPAFPGVAGEAITDGGVTWTEQNAALDAGTAQVPPSGGAYARASLTASLANWSGTQGAATTVASSGTSGQSSNNAAITFPAPTADWVSGTARIWGWAIYDASSAGNLWAWGPLNATQLIANGQLAPSFSAAQLALTIGD